MPVLLRIAFRNLLEHKAKSLIIGILLALGVVILVVGNAFMDTAAQGVRDNFTANYTGEIFIAAASKESVSLFGPSSMTGNRDKVSVLPHYDRILERLSATPGVAAAAGQVTGFGMATLKGYEEEDKDDSVPSVVILFGVEPSSYFRLFESVKPTKGRLLGPGEKGIVLSARSFKNLSKKAGHEPELGDEVVITGMSGSGFAIRSVPIVGVFGDEEEETGTGFICYADVDTVRILSGLTLGNDEDTVITEEQQGLLAASEDDLFGGETVVQASQTVAAAPAAPAAPRPKTMADAGAWYFAMARLENPAAAPGAIASLNAWFAQEGIEARAGDWKVAAGPFATSIDVVRIVFNVAIIIVSVVAVIIMMNTLVISVIERTGEIGTMRALGAQRGFVRRMFLAETLTVAAVFGLVGAAVALGTIGVLNACEIEASNAFLKVLFAGKVLHTQASPGSVVSSLVLVGLVAVVAHLYPVSLALKVQPVRAMQTE